MMLMKTAGSLPLTLLCVAAQFPVVVQATSFKFSIAANPFCDGSPFATSGVTTSCSNSCEPGDTVQISGLVKASSGFDSNAKVRLQPCVSGPTGMVSYYCYDPQDTGGICDWVTSPTVSCGAAASDYVIYKQITIPKESEQLEKFGSFLTIKVKAIIGGEEECEADYGAAYGSTMAMSIAGVALAVGLVARRQKQRRQRRGVIDEQNKAYFEMTDTVASAGGQTSVPV